MTLLDHATNSHFIGNLLAWMAQSCIVAMVAAILPQLFRVRDPRTRIAYGYAAIVVCLLLPLQPRAHVPATSMSTLVGSRLLLILASGAVVRLIWIGFGLWRIRNYRIGATPLYPVPEGLQAASAITHADALFCISGKTLGPVMMGWLAPVVLLPESFENLSEESQIGIGCHELLHVRRGDWLRGLIEEFVAAAMWFNPGIWMLLSQTRLALEQLVDSEVVRLTGVRDQYIDALMAMARSRTLDSVPAPLFLRRRHLSQRMLALLSDAPKSRLRLVASYSSIVAILCVTGWMAASAFPLQERVPATVTKAARVAGLANHAVTPQIIVGSPNQSARPITPALRSGVEPNIAAIDMPPPDPREPVTGGIEIAATPQQRAAAFQLLDRARVNALTHNREMHPFHFTASYTASGSTEENGTGELSEIWMNGQRWRWTVQSGKGSIVRLATEGKRYENGHVNAIPMRAHMLRNELYWAAGGFPTNAQARTARILWNGKPATCILTSYVTGAAAQIQARLWDEEEYCIDNESGVLVEHSVAPGTFALLGYDAPQFYGRSLPARITIYVAGEVAADASFRFTDTGVQDEATLTPGPEMTFNPPPVGTQLPNRMSIVAPAGAAPASGSAQSVMVHADVDGTGKIAMSEVSSAGNPALRQAALDLVAQTPFGYTGAQRQTYVKVVFSR